MTRQKDPATVARMQITLRLDRDLVFQIDELASEKAMERSELARRLLADGLAQHRVMAGVSDVGEGRRSIWDAADHAGVSLYEMLDRVVEAGIPEHLDPDVIERIRSGPNTPPVIRPV
jgi:hypothetical protein